MFTKKVYITYKDLDRLARKGVPIWDSYCGLYRVVSSTYGGILIDDSLVRNEEDFLKLGKNRYCVYRFSLFGL